MKSTIILRLLKALIFILAVFFYGLTPRHISDLFFAVALAMYLIELYKGGKQ